MSLRNLVVCGVSTVVCALACSAQTPAPETPTEGSDGETPPPAAGDSEAPALESEVAAESAQPDAASEQSGGEGEPAPKEALSKLCNKMCDAVAPKCTDLQLKGCRSTCDNYETHPAACDGVVRTALECARADKDFLFCANVVPDSCAKQFKAINICKETGKPPEDAAAKGLPAGWERFEGDGFSVVVPKGMKASNEGGTKKWSVKGDNGIVYEVAIHPPPGGAKLDNRAFLRSGNQVFGACSPKLKLHALVEKPGETSIQYNTTCPNGNKQVGRMHVIGSKMYVLSAYLGTSSGGETDAFVYSFEPN